VLGVICLNEEVPQGKLGKELPGKFTSPITRHGDQPTRLELKRNEQLNRRKPASPIPTVKPTLGYNTGGGWCWGEGVPESKRGGGGSGKRRGSPVLRLEIIAGVESLRNKQKT